MTTPPDLPDPSRELRQLVEAGCFREALDAHSRWGPETAGRPEVELLSATAATRIGEYGLGVTYAEAALDQFRRRADSDGRMRVMNLLGAIAFEQGRLDDAERCFGEALDQARMLEDSRMAAHASNNLASVAHLQSRPDLALSLYRSALLEYQRLGDRRGTAQTYHNLGLAFRQRADWEDADDSSHQAVRHAEQVAEPSLLALAIMGRAELHLHRDELGLAERELTRAERLALEAMDDVGLADASRLRGLLALRQGNPAGAEIAAREARAIAERIGSVQLMAECTAVLATALHRQGRESESAPYRAEARAIFTRLGATNMLEDFERMLM
ncbi:MAG: tetratricopeptide repeat protein [Gemmatimonadota bacterium]|nr:tetratricopeptide repeat protein [Gemmatimonadota bacterium]